MDGAVAAEIPVTQEAALLLKDSARAESVRRLFSRLLRPTKPEADPLAPMIRELKAEAHGAGLTDAEIDAELAAYNAEKFRLCMAAADLSAVSAVSAPLDAAQLPSGLTVS